MARGFRPELATIVKHREADDVRLFVVKGDEENVKMDRALDLFEDQLQNDIETLQAGDRIVDAIHHHQPVNVRGRRGFL